jgi:Tfp pilus assembly protein PilO
MRRDFRGLKFILLIVLGALFAADSAMTIVSTHSASSSMTPQRQLATQAALLKLLRADVKRAREIRQAIPKTKADCELFENSLPPYGEGYSVISAEFQDLGQKAGLQIGSVSFHRKDITAHGITEISVDASINGDYKSVVRFVNGLQHSKNHYVVDDLTLANDRVGSGTQSGVRVNLHMRSYFRAVA